MMKQLVNGLTVCMVLLEALCREDSIQNPVPSVSAPGLSLVNSVHVSRATGAGGWLWEGDLI